MRKTCRYCGGTHANGETCPQKPTAQKYVRKKIRRDVDAFRSTAAWTAKSAEIRMRDLYCCRLCLAEGRITMRDLGVHHIVPLMADFDKRLDNDNLITLCASHHRQADAGRIPRAELAALAAQPAMLGQKQHPPRVTRSSHAKRQDRRATPLHTKSPKPKFNPPRETEAERMTAWHDRQKL